LQQFNIIAHIDHLSCHNVPLTRYKDIDARFQISQLYAALLAVNVRVGKIVINAFIHRVN